MKANGRQLRSQISVSSNLHNHIKVVVPGRKERGAENWVKGTPLVEKKGRKRRSRARNAGGETQNSECGEAGWDWIARDYDT